MDDDDVCVIPDTPSPSMKSSNMYRNRLPPYPGLPQLSPMIDLTELDDSYHLSPNKSNPLSKSPSAKQSGSSERPAYGLAIPGQANFAKERAAAVKRKRKKDKYNLSPFKCKDSAGLGMDTSESLDSLPLAHRPFPSHRPRTKASATSTSMTPDQETTDFVRSSSLISPTKLAIYNKPSSSTSGTTNILGLNTQSLELGNVGETVESDVGRLKKQVKSPVIKHKKRTRGAIAWPSSSESSGDEREALSKCVKKLITRGASKKPLPDNSQSHNLMPFDKTSYGVSPKNKNSSRASSSCARNGDRNEYGNDLLWNNLPTRHTTPPPPVNKSSKQGRDNIASLFGHLPATDMEQGAASRDPINQHSIPVAQTPKTRRRSNRTGSKRGQGPAASYPSPQTERALSAIQQMENDEEMARKLQEEMDHEFAMSLERPDTDEMYRTSSADSDSHTDTSRHHHHHRHTSSHIHSPDDLVERAWQSGFTMSRFPHDVGIEVPATDPNAFLQMILGAHNHIDMNLGGPRRRGRGIMRTPGRGRRNARFAPSDADDSYERFLNLAERIGEVKDSGLSKAEMGRLPTVAYKKKEGAVEECNICMTDYNEGDSQKILPCFHSYHAACIDTWIKKNATCPICRVAVQVTTP